ncbi:MAG TPA: hypothetical protein VGE07_20790 [Herpetosiphonaceae bacterium]
MDQTPVNLIHDDELTDAELDRIAGGGSDDPNGGGNQFPVEPPQVNIAATVAGISVSLAR